jgi:cytochrome P450
MLRDDLGQLIFAPQVTVVEDFETSTEILRQHQHFLQWDGSFITADGRLALLGQLENDSAAGAIPVASASRLQPESDRGPFCFAQTPVFLDEPEHTRFRRLLAETWQTGSAARALESQTALLAEDLLHSAVTGPPVEFIRSVATPLSATVLAWFFGGPPDPWIELALGQQSRTPQNEAASLPSVTAFQQHVWDLLGRRNRVPENDTVSRMVRHDARGDAFRPAEIATLILQTALVSNETVIRLLGSVAAAMAERSDFRLPSDGDAQRISQLVGSVLRDHPPLRGVFRRAAHQCTVGGTEFQPGAGIFVDIKRANRYSSTALGPGQAANAATSSGGHLSFGAGIHRCPGAALATMEAVVLARALCALPSLRIASASDGPAEEPAGLLEGPASLWLGL